MRILVISIYYKPEPVPKPHELAEGLVQRGHTVTTLTSFPNYPSGRLYPNYTLRSWKIEWVNGVRVIRLPLYPDHSARSLARAAHIVSFFLSVLLLGPFLSGPVDVVYVWGNPPTSGLAGWILSRLRRAPFVYGVHDLWPELASESGLMRNPLILNLIDALERFVLRRADLVLPISHGFRQRILEKGVSAERVQVIPHWADEMLFRPVPREAALAERLGLDHCFVVLYAGNIGRLQGLEALAEAAGLLKTEMPNLRVVLVGDGVERARLKARAAAQHLDNVVFVERQPPEAIPAYAALADALYVGLVESSLARLSVPSKIPTYMACGRPILSSVPGETAALIERGGLGINCPSSSPQAIADGIRRMAALSAPERTSMGQKAREVFLRDYAITPLLVRHEALMQALLVQPELRQVKMP